MQAFARLLERIYKVHSVERETPERIHVVWGEWQRFKSLPDQIMYGQIFGRKLVKPLRIEKSRNGRKRNRSLTMLEKLRGFTLSIRMTKSAQKLSKKKTGKTWGSSHAMQARQTASLHRENECRAEKMEMRCHSKQCMVCRGISWIHEAASRIFAV